MSGAEGEATESESAAGTVTAANVKSVMMARHRALRAVAAGSTRMFSSLRSAGGRVYGLCACHEGEDMILNCGAPPRARGGAREYERAVVRGDEPRAPRVSVC